MLFFYVLNWRAGVRLVVIKFSVYFKKLFIKYRYFGVKSWFFFFISGSFYFKGSSKNLRFVLMNPSTSLRVTETKKYSCVIIVFLYSWPEPERRTDEIIFDLFSKNKLMNIAISGLHHNFTFLLDQKSNKKITAWKLKT